MKENTHKTIVFITGAFVHHSCWDQWRCFFEQKDYNTIVPPWPGKEQSAEKLRLGHPDRMVAGIRLAALTEYYGKLIGDLSQKPILIGHSMGGLTTSFCCSGILPPRELPFIRCSHRVFLHLNFHFIKRDGQL